MPAFGIRADFFRGKLKGDNKNTLDPNRPTYGFNTDINWSASLSGELTLATINWLTRQTTVQPYITAGAGYMGYKPRIQATAGGAFTDFASSTRDLRELVIPVGVGLKFNLSKSVNLDLGYTMSFVDNDKLDGTYFGSNSDRFSYGHAGLEFSLGDKSKPQLATYNPVAAMQYDYMAQDKALRSSIAGDLAAAKSADAATIAALQSELAAMKADADGDGVSDYFDKCPGTPAGTKVDGSGCPLPAPPAPAPQQPTTVIITEADRQIVAEAIKNLEFDFNKSTIRPRSFPSLNRVAQLLIEKNFSLKLAGHTDNVGSDAYNLKLSKDRAESVKAYLVSKGANPSRIEATGYGESQPIATNANAAGRQKNRRVEFTLY
jgi:OOP family OmpA-OmpF porin